MQQLGFDFMKAERRIDAPTAFKIDFGKRSYGEITVVPREDGTFAIKTGDDFNGYCGHGGPAHGAYATFEAALTYAVRYLRRGWYRIANDHNDSCCSEKHRVMARKGLVWLDTLIADYALNIGEGLCDA